MPDFRRQASILCANVRDMLGESQKYEILAARDEAYAGMFIAAIRTTGIYCRPGCPARTPKPQNCEYFSTASDAAAAGYRACKRCHPDTPFISPAKYVEAALEALARDPLKVWREADVSQLGWDNSTLRRQFQKRYGMTFLAYARAQRLKAAADKLIAGESVINAQIDAGYGSSSGFRAAYKAQFGTSPGKPGAPPLYVDWIETPFGRMVSLSDAQALFLLEFVDRKNMQGQLSRLMRYYDRPIAFGATDISQQTRAELAAYFNGERQSFSVPLKLTGTPFQSAVWQALIDIPYGQTRSYAELAVSIGSQKAVRAVASSNARNALAIIIPCHRVIGKNGSMTGYAGGTERKLQLLTLEGAVNPSLL